MDSGTDKTTKEYNMDQEIKRKQGPRLSNQSQSLGRLIIDPAIQNESKLFTQEIPGDADSNLAIDETFERFQ